MKVPARVTRTRFSGCGVSTSIKWPVIQTTDPLVRATVLPTSSQATAVRQLAMGPPLGAIGVVLSIRAAIVTAGLLLSPVLPLYARTLRGEKLVTADAASEAGAVVLPGPCLVTQDDA